LSLLLSISISFSSRFLTSVLVGVRVYRAPLGGKSVHLLPQPAAIDRKLDQQVDNVAGDPVKRQSLPPYGVLDQAPGSAYKAGCRQPLAVMKRVKHRLRVFAHANGCYGALDTPDKFFTKVALLGLDGGLSNPPVVLQMSR